MQLGWKDTADKNLKPYQNTSRELSVQDSRVLWGSRVIIPKAGRNETLQVCHDGHPGIINMKKLARSVVWWPGIDSDIEKRVKSCEMCSLHQGSLRVPVPFANSSQTVRVLRQVISTHGISEIIVLDIGFEFTSSEFQMFRNQNGIRHLKSAPYHPLANGLAERAVQIFKRGMRKRRPGELETKLACFLSHYRTTPHATTGPTLAELLLCHIP